MHIIVKNYEHFNRSMGNWDTPKGKYIKSKSQYENEMAKQGLKPVEQFGQVSEASRKEYKLSEKARAIIESARSSKDSKGRVKLSDRTIDAMKSIGALGKKIPSYMQLPSAYNQGGFSK